MILLRSRKSSKRTHDNIRFTLANAMGVDASALHRRQIGFMMPPLAARLTLCTASASRSDSGEAPQTIDRLE
jgi:hypothetical protein